MLKLISLQIWSQSSKYTFSFKSILNILLICWEIRFRKQRLKHSQTTQNKPKNWIVSWILTFKSKFDFLTSKTLKIFARSFLKYSLPFKAFFFWNCWRCLFNLLYCVIRVTAISPRQCVLSDVLLFKPRLT